MQVKAYRNIDFLTSPEARALRILAEYVEPESRFRKLGIDNAIAFFGSARAPARDQAEGSLAAARKRGAADDMIRRLEAQVRLSKYYEEARELARLLTEWALSFGEEEPFVICSGGGPGIMEAANRGASEAGGRSVGLNISIPREQQPNLYISDDLNLEYHYFFMRKLWFVQLACAVVVFPGGYGTLDELGELLTLMQTGRSKLLPTVVYGREFWDDVLNMKALERWGVIGPEDLDLFRWADTPEEAFNYLREQLEPRFSEQ